MAGGNFIDAKKLVEQLTQLMKEHKAAIDNASKSLKDLGTQYANLPSDYVKTQKELIRLKVEEEKVQKALIQTEQQREKLRQSQEKTEALRSKEAIRRASEEQKAQKKALTEESRARQQLSREKQQQDKEEQARRQQLQRTIATESRTRQTLVREQQQQARAAEKEEKANRDLNSAWVQLRKSLDKAEREYRDLAAAQGLSDDRTRAAAANVNRLRAQYDAINTPINRMNANVGNYPKTFGIATKAITGLVGAFGVMEGLRMAWDFGKEALALAREAKGVEFAFRDLGEAGREAFNDVKEASRGTLSDLDIKTSLVDFQNFNLDLEQAGILFEFLTVRATQTGKSVEYLRDSLVEGLSKESKLRIDNLGISAMDLNAELEKTPEFIQAVANIARREVAEAGGILDEASNSGDRLSASFENAKLQLGQLFEGSSTGILGLFADQLDRIADGFVILKSGISLATDGFDRFLAPFKEIVSESPMLQRYLSMISTIIRASFTPSLTAVGTVLREVGGFLGGMGEAISSVIKNLRATLDILSMLGDIEIDFANPARMAQQAKATLSAAKNVFLGIGKSASEAYHRGYYEVMNSKNSEIVEEEKKKASAIIGEEEKVQKILKGTISYYEGIISGLERQQKELARNSEEYASYGEKIEEASLALSRLKSELQGVSTVSVGFDEATNMADFLESMQDATSGGISGIGAGDINDALEEDLRRTKEIEQEKTRITEQESQRRTDIVFNSLESFGEFYGVDLGAFRNLFDEKKNTIQDYATAAQEILTFALNQRLSGYDAEIEKAAAARDLILNNERSSEEAKLAAEREFARKEAQIKNEQAKKERENALIQVAVNTAIGVTQALATVPPPASFILAGIIATMGGIQAGLISSQPLPQFAEGTDNAPQGWAVVDEVGAEIHTDRHGNIKSMGSDKGANLRYLERGDKIFPAGSEISPDGAGLELQKILWNLGVNTPKKESDRDSETLEELRGLRKDNKKLKNALDSFGNRPINITVNDKNRPYYG